MLSLTLLSSFFFFSTNSKDISFDGGNGELSKSVIRHYVTVDRPCGRKHSGIGMTRHSRGWNANCSMK